MKTNFLKFGLPISLLTIATLVIGPACIPQARTNVLPTQDVCFTSTSSPFEQVFYQVKYAKPSFTDITSMDFVTHEYTFILVDNQTICSIGYQGNANLFAANIAYTIEIYNNTTRALVYSGNHKFISQGIDYHPISGITLAAKQSYTIRRIASNYLGDIGNTTGRILNFGSATGVFPVSNPAIKITGSNFYSSGGSAENRGIPYIDIVFK